MKALGKILGLVVLGLLLIIVALGFALTHLFDPNDYKDEIRQLARDKAGVELNIAGDIGWSLFPWLGLELHDTTVASTRTPDQPFADLRMLGLSVRVMPLLQREIRMSDIQINGLDLNLVRDEKGRGNWEGIGEAAGTAAPAKTPEPAQAPAGEPRRALALDIDSLSVTDARVNYRDARTGQSLSAEGIDLTTGAIREGAPIPVELNAFFGSNKPVMRARTELKGVLRFDTALKRYQLEGLQLNGEASGEPLNGKTLTFTVQGELLVDLAANIAELNGLKLSANQLRALGQVSARDLQGEPKLSGALSVAAFDLGEFLAGLGIDLPPMADGKALQHVELVTRLAGTSKGLALEDLKLQLDDTTLAGRIAIENFDTQALRVSLKGDRLDLDRYLPPPTEEEKAKASARDTQSQVAIAGAGTTPLPQSPTEQAWSDETVLPVDRLRKLDTRLALGLDQLTVEHLPLDDFTLKARSANGLLQLEELRGRLYGGNVQANARLDVRPAVPQLSVEKRLTDVPLEPLLKAQEETVVIKGLMDLTADLRTEGNSQKAWIDNLDGTIKFNVDNGVLVDANLEQQLCRAIATLNRKPLTGEPRGKDTPFRQLSATLNLDNGVASNRDLLVAIPGLSVKGNGDIDLRVLGMDYRIGAIIEGDKSDMPDPACQVNERYVGLEWPLRCRGPLELGARACRFDQEALGKVAAKLAGEKLNEKIEEKLGDKVSPELKDALKGLFGR